MLATYCSIFVTTHKYYVGSVLRKFSECENKMFDYVCKFDWFSWRKEQKTPLKIMLFYKCNSAIFLVVCVSTDVEKG